MFVVCVEFEIMPRHLEDFLVAMRKNAAQSHALEAGCQQFDVCQDQQNPNTIFYMKFMMMRPRLRRIKPRRIIMNSTIRLMVWL